MGDFDRTVKYWFKDIPYIWIGSKNVKECQRWYFLSPSEGAYDSENRVGTQRAWEIQFQRFKDLELFAVPCKSWIKSWFKVLPFSGDSLRVSGGRLFVSSLYGDSEKEWVHTKGKKFEFRLEGKKLDNIPENSPHRLFGTVENPKTKKLSEVAFAPGTFSMSLDFPLYGFRSEAASIVDKETGTKFTTLYDLAVTLKIPIEERKNLHQQCLGLTNNRRFLYLWLYETNLKKKRRMQITTEWFEKVWSGKLFWGGPPMSSLELFYHEPYQNSDLVQRESKRNS